MNGNAISAGRLAEIDAQAITLARVRGVRDKRPTNHTMTWGERKTEVLVAAANPRRGSASTADYHRDRALSKDATAIPADRNAAKARCLAQKNGPATIGAECAADENGKTGRSGANFLLWSTLALDVDPGNCPPEFLDALREVSGCVSLLGAAVWHETHSSTDDARAVRVELLLKEPTPTVDRNAAGEVLAAQLEADFPGLKVDRASVKDVQIMFEPSCPSDGPPRMAGVLLGEPVDAIGIAAMVRAARESEQVMRDEREFVEGQRKRGGSSGGQYQDDAPELCRQWRAILSALDIRVEPGHAKTVDGACVCPDASHAPDGIARAEWVEKGVWYCRVCRSGGNIITYVSMLKGCERKDSFNVCRRAVGMPERQYSARAKAAKGAASAGEGIDDTDGAAPNGGAQDDAANEGRRSQADMLAVYGEECALFIDEGDGDSAFADIVVDGHRETLRLASSYFRRWLHAKFYAEHKKTVRGEAIGQAIDALSARARFAGECTMRLVHLRTAFCRGNTYIDLCSKEWSAVEVGPNGWRVVAEPPVRFRRTKGMGTLPIPTVGNIERLREFVNLKADGDFVLFVGWLLQTLRGQKPFPLLSLLGQEGTAKTTLCLIAKALTDPNVNPLRSLPGNQQDMMVGAGGQHVIVYDNVSTIAPWLSDALCRMAYGSGASYRRLYSDDEEAVLAAARPVILNGITEHVTRGDLASRTVGVTLEYIPPEARRDEEEFWAAFEEARPAIFGALLDGVAHGLRALPSIKTRDLPRMAGFARWGMACEGAYWEEGTFEAAYNANIGAISSETLESESVIVALRNWMDAPEQTGGWKGSTSTLLCTLKAGLTGDKPKDWPASPQAFSGVLRRCTPALRGVGVHVVLGRKNSRSHVTIERGETPRAGASSASVQTPPEPVDEPDELDAHAQGASPPDKEPAIDPDRAEDGEAEAQSTNEPDATTVEDCSNDSAAGRQHGLWDSPPRPKHPPKGFIHPETGDEADGDGGWVMA